MTTTTSLPIGDTIKAAWEKVYGAKASLWAAFILLQVIAIILGIVGGTISGVIPKAAPFINCIFMIACSIVMALATAGFEYMGIQRAKGATICYKDMFYPVSSKLSIKVIVLMALQYFAFIMPLILIFSLAMIAAKLASYSVIMVILEVTITIAAPIITIYLLLSMKLSAGYVLIEKMNPIAAIKRSFNATKSNLIELLGVYLMLLIILFVLSLPFGIGLIWGIPFIYVLYGEVYLRLANNAQA